MIDNVITHIEGLTPETRDQEAQIRLAAICMRQFAKGRTLSALFLTYAHLERASLSVSNVSLLQDIRLAQGLVRGCATL